MAQRRMFSMKIVGSDAFLDMPFTSRELYFQMGMYADDDGFVSPRKIMRMTGAGEDDLKILIAKRFLIPFENGVVVVKHWKMNNELKKDRYTPTQYEEQKRTLFLKENGAYTQDPNQGKPLCIQNVSIMDTQVRIGKDSIGKDSIDNNTGINPGGFDLFWYAYPKKTDKKKSRDLWDKKKLDTEINSILEFIEKAKQTDRWKKGFIKDPKTFINNESWNDDLESYKSFSDNKKQMYVAN